MEFCKKRKETNGQIIKSLTNIKQQIKRNTVQMRVEKLLLQQENGKAITAMCEHQTGGQPARNVYNSCLTPAIHPTDVSNPDSFLHGQLSIQAAKTAMPTYITPV